MRGIDGVLLSFSDHTLFKPDESHAAVVAAPILRLYQWFRRFLPGGSERCGVRESLPGTG